ncbi:hypothetical protein SBA4_5390007 [Candidatus Sulfopaludibacter sp. SbA4]|nr:hypothetical protein SBA4_5390007 [Candidatus Sulfopaludibacter sp. SbA4]
MIPAMSTALDHLEPQAVWKHFAALAAIPRASEKEAAARDYVLALAARLGLEAVQDPAGNTVVRKPALAQGGWHHAGGRQWGRRIGRAGRHGKRHCCPWPPGICVHDRRRERPHRRYQVSHRAPRVQVLPQSRQRRGGHPLHRVRGRREFRGAAQDRAARRPCRRSVAHQDLGPGRRALGRRHSSRPRQRGAHSGPGTAGSTRPYAARDRRHQRRK